MKRRLLLPAYTTKAAFLSFSSLSLKNTEEKCISLLTSTTCIHQFKQILGVFFTNGLQNSSFVATKLLDFCNSSSQMHLAASIFYRIPHQSAFLWTSMIKGLAQNGLHYQSILFFKEMGRAGTDPIHLTFPFVLKACGSLWAVLEAKQIHTNVIKMGFLPNCYVQNSLLDCYVKCRLIEHASLLYVEMPQRDIVSHTSMISGYFGVGDLVSARIVFDGVEEADVVLWSAMVAGYAQNGAAEEALELFKQMRCSFVKPNSITMVSVLSACAQLGDFEKGKQFHDFIVENGIKMDMIVCTSLLDMYIKGGFNKEAREVFDRMKKKDVVSWNSLISGYSKNGCPSDALQVFKEMQEFGIEPNRATVLGVVSSCAQLGTLKKGKEMESLAKKMMVETDLSIGTALIDMYAKCGSLIDACRVFNTIDPRDVIMWSAMINGYAINGNFGEAFSLFGGMLKEGIMPNEVTYLAILIACSHRGLVQEGFEFFISMRRDHGIQPNMEHYACMVDILGRSGRVEEAKTLIDHMHIEPSANVWGSLLGACVTHKNIEVGNYAAQHLVELEPNTDQNFVFLSNIYAATNRWDDVHNVRTAMKCRGTHKIPGCSWVEVGGSIHEFLVGDRAHPLDSKVYGILDSLSVQLRLAGSSSLASVEY